ncbi:hypothetical protein WJX77_000097 [Trebouxia sp. C0004]
MTNQRVEHAQASLLVRVEHFATGHKFQENKGVSVRKAGMARRRVQYGVVNASDADVGAGAPGFRTTWQSKDDLRQQVMKISDVPNNGKLYFWDGQLWLRWDDPDDLPGPEGDPLRIKIVCPQNAGTSHDELLLALGRDCWCLLTNDILPSSTVIGSHLFKSGITPCTKGDQWEPYHFETHARNCQALHQRVASRCNAKLNLAS